MKIKKLSLYKSLIKTKTKLNIYQFLNINKGMEKNEHFKLCVVLNEF